MSINLIDCNFQTLTLDKQTLVGFTTICFHRFQGILRTNMKKRELADIFVKNCEQFVKTAINSQLIIHLLSK